MHGFLLTTLTVLLITISTVALFPQAVSARSTFWDFQSIDTMKYSRDPSRQFAEDLNNLLNIANEQIAAIAQTGATHVGIATPYDEEFVPVLTTWVTAAREHGLSVWFRGNLSGWEGWFEYPSLSRQAHLQNTVQFIEKHPELFQNGDIFSACPECENGGPGDPRQTGDVAGHRQFLIDERQAVMVAFRNIGKNIDTSFNSMNGDVARLVMDPATTKALGGLVVIDHYVKTPEQLNADVTQIAQLSGGRVVLGEMGVPIPDIHGQMTEAEQAAWLQQALALLVRNPVVKGVSYWTNLGGSTALWNDTGAAKLATSTLTSFFQPSEAPGRVLNSLGQSLESATIIGEYQELLTESDGSFAMPYLETDELMSISAQGYEAETVAIADLLLNSSVKLEPVNPSLWYRVQLWFHALFS